jgi:hypothetical protein
MKQKIQIAIPAPCHKGWQNMTPVEKGRFCATCQKTVLDFTHLSDNEIINLVSKNDDLCARINVSQLNRNLIKTKTKSNYFGYFATSVLAFLGLGTENVVAQEKPFVVQTDLRYLNKNLDSVKKITVSGLVLVDEGKPFPGVSIVRKNTIEGTQTNINGEYRIEAALGDTLVFSFLGYKEYEIIVKSSKMNTYLHKDDNVVIEGYLISLKKRTFLGRIFRKKANWYKSS